MGWFVLKYFDDSEDKLSEYYIIGIDGGATRSHGVLYDEQGRTLAHAPAQGTSLTVYPKIAQKRIINMITQMTKEAGIPTDNIDALGIAVAGASDEDGRDIMFGELDCLGLSRRSLIASDTEAALEVNWPSMPGILVSVGTGMMCLARSADGKYHRTGGLGHQAGDVGSGYWLGRNLLMHLALNDLNLYGDQELMELGGIILETLEGDDLTDLIEEVMEDSDQVRRIASLAAPICQSAEQGNEIALALVQEASQGVADTILELLYNLGYSEKILTLAGNGGVIRNDLYRKLLNEALRFDYPDLRWLFSDVSPAYGAGILAGRLMDIEVDLREIVKQGAIAPTDR